MIQQSHFWAYVQKNSKQDLHTHVHSIIIHNIKKVEATQLSTHEWIKETWNIRTMNITQSLKGKKLCHMLQHG